MRFLDDERLYRDTDACLAFLRGLEAGSPARSRPEPVHFYWRGEISRKQAFALQSFLRTQSPDLVEPWLWLDSEDGWSDRERNPELQRLGTSLRVLRWDAAAEARETPLDGRPVVLGGTSPTSRSDVFRHLVLWKHGGLYADLDLLFLRDLRPLLASPEAAEFCSSWSVGHPFANSAVLRLRQGGETACELMDRASAMDSCHPRALLQFDDCRDLDLLVLPCGYFDPLWPHHDRRERLRAAPFDRFDDFFRPFGLRFRRRRGVGSMRDFFPGAFAYHWHNFWDAREVPSSYFGQFAAELDQTPEGLPDTVSFARMLSGRS